MPFKNQHPLYHVWQGMLNRCRNPKNRQWDDYGGRGIDVCDQWKRDFKQFVADMGPRPDGYSLDRVDNDLGYSPENCRWTDRKTQQRNRRNSVYVSVEGVEYRAIELSEAAGVKLDTIIERAGKGLPLKQVLSRKKLKRRIPFRTHCSKGHTLDETNTYTTKEGWRRCRACHNAKMRRYNAAKKSP